jgi:hypothetical protein
MLDEIQYVSEFEDVLNSYLKISNADVYVTGSNSRFLSSDVITTFRGRGDEIRIAPLSFREFMTVFEGSREKGLETYLTFGGMPKLATIADDSKKTHTYQTLKSATTSGMMQNWRNLSTYLLLR